MKNFVSRIWDAISYPFVSLAITLDEDRRQNLDGSWDKYWAKKNCRAELRVLKAQYKADKTIIRNKWRINKDEKHG